MKLKIKEVAGLLSETPEVIRNWVRDYKGLIPLEKAENGYNLFGPEALDVLRTIQQLNRKQGYSTRQIIHHLQTGGEVAAAADADPGAAAAEIAELKVMMKQLIDSHQRQEDFNRQLVARLDQGENRDRLITDYITERRQLEASRQEQQRPWWKFWGKG